MNRRVLLPALAALAVVLAVSASAQAALFNRTCSAAPSCCGQVAPCEAVKACAPACCEKPKCRVKRSCKPTCCEKPACCEPSCCKAKRCHTRDRGCKAKCCGAEASCCGAEGAAVTGTPTPAEKPAAK